MHLAFHSAQLLHTECHSNTRHSRAIMCPRKYTCKSFKLMLGALLNCEHNRANRLRGVLGVFFFSFWMWRVSGCINHPALYKYGQKKSPRSKKKAIIHVVFFPDLWHSRQILKGCNFLCEKATISKVTMSWSRKGQSEESSRPSPRVPRVHS